MGRIHDLSYRFFKALDTLAYVALGVLTWRLIEGELHWRIVVGAALISGCWLALTWLRMGQVFKTYFDLLSRIEFLLPACLGISLSCYAGIFAPHWAIRSVAAAEIVAWIFAIALYRLNRRRYVKQGHGPVPAHCWISPPADVLKPGDLLLTSGNVAARLHESVGHAEVVLRMDDGSMGTLSSCMGRGALARPLHTLTEHVRGHYIALRPAERLTEEQISRCAEIARQMLKENARWRKNSNRRRRKQIKRLPLPRSWKRRIFRLTITDGYDWFGLFMGRRARYRWTCIGACLEVYARLEIKTDPYGTGILGFGTTLLDPINPVRLLADPAFRLLSLKDQTEP